MSAITIPLDPDTEAKLDEIAAATKRGKSEIVADAVAAFARDEAETIAKIKRGMADVEAGRTVPHEQVMREMREIIEQAKQRRK
ncbi:MAG TPA: ribbon-helix-helix protein, CopG family [Vitreimonas sp.]|uniref:CopG family ribbon-helix-helix protein n=1 Tax=Vitreimonas sp. TaxID=3069702 RepID=UPI002D3A8562|nr:ribbon-helix-helix protein, CopG family [Vitreimonas sp.]HYD87667.1 ribbon-helix-helix protein, CopG family [Vitreimonas sp.]